jgi:transposase-like protein
MPTPHSSPRRSRWTEEEAVSVLGALKRSGKSVREFAEERGLDPQRLYAWRRRVAGGDRTTFREVTVRPVTVDATTRVFEIVLPSGVKIRAASDFDAGALARLLDVLRQAGAC